MEKRTMFRWHAKHDVDLLKEVVSTRPKQSLDWNKIAENLVQAWGEGISIKGRSCKEHFDVLLQHFRSGNNAALKKSGTEEDYTEINMLLDDISSYLEDQKMNQPTTSSSKKAKDEQDKKKARDMRDAAMSSLKTKPSSLDSGTTQASSSESEDEVSQKAPKRKRAQRPDVMSYLKERKEAETEFREKELEYKRDALQAETQLKKDALAVEQRRIQLQEQQIKMQLELFKALVNKSSKE